MTLGLRQHHDRRRSCSSCRATSTSRRIRTPRSGANFRRTPDAPDPHARLRGDAALEADAATIESTTTSFGSQVVADKCERFRRAGIGIGALDVTLVDLLQRTTGLETLQREQLGRLLRAGAGRLEQPPVPHRRRARRRPLVVRHELRPRSSTRSCRLSYVAVRGAGGSRRCSMRRASTRSSCAARGDRPGARRPRTPRRRRTRSTASRSARATGSALRTLGVRQSGSRSRSAATEIELGFDAGLFSDRLGVDFTYYNKTTDDMLQSIVAAAPSTGFIGTRLVNLGEVHEPWHRDLGVRHAGPDGNDLSWDTRLNFSTNHNELMSFGVRGQDHRTRRPARRTASVQQHRVGLPARRLLGDAAAARRRTASARAHTRPARRSTPPATRRAATSARPRRRARSASRTRSRSSATSASTRCSTTRAATSCSTSRSGAAARRRTTTARGRTTRARGSRRPRPTGAVQGARGVPQHAASARSGSRRSTSSSCASSRSRSTCRSDSLARARRVVG